MLSRHRTGGRFKCDPDVKRFGRSNALWAGHGGSGSGDGIMSLASLDLDFTNNQGRGPGGATKPVASFLTTTRASTAYAPNAAGVYSSFASNVPRITDLGLLVEEARTNSIRNNSMQGASAPSTFPTNWFGWGLSVGITPTVAGVGTEDGIDYIDVNFAGTASATSVRYSFDATTAVAASQGQVWTESLFMRLMAGSLGTAQPQIEVRDVVSGVGGNATQGNITPTSAPLSSQRGSVTRTLADVGTTTVAPNLRIALTNGNVYDFTLRIGWPQLELGAFATSPIRTTGAAATRAADLITVNNFSSWYTAGPGTMFADYSVTADSPASIFPGAFTLDDGTVNNRINLHSRTIDDTRRAEIVTAGVSQGSMSDFVAFTYGVAYKTALALATNDAAFSVAGSAVATDASVTLPTVTAARLGVLIAGGTGPLNGYIRRVAYFPTRLTNAQLQTITAPSAVATLDLDFVSNLARHRTVGALTADSFLTTTRASDGYAPNAAGVYSSFASNVPRITDLGLLVEEARTNSIRNNSGTGASAPSTPPTNITLGGAVGLTATYSAAGSSNGIDYWDIRLVGTSGSTTATLLLEASQIIAATNGQTWAYSFFAGLVGGSITNINNIVGYVRLQDSGGASLSDLTAVADFKGSLTPSLTRFSGVATANNASTAYVRPLIAVFYASGVAIDITLRIGWPQLELGAFATSPIRTTSAAATRAADRIVGPALTVGSALTLFAEMTAGGSATVQGVAQVDEGIAANRVFLWRNNTTPSGNVREAGVDSASLSNGTLAAGSSGKLVIAAASNDAAFCFNGGTVQTDATVTFPTGMNRLVLGQNGAGIVSLNGYIRRVAYFPTRLTNAQLQAITT